MLDVRASCCTWGCPVSLLVASTGFPVNGTECITGNRIAASVVGQPVPPLLDAVAAMRHNVMSSCHIAMSCLNSHERKSVGSGCDFACECLNQYEAQSPRSVTLA